MTPRSCSRATLVAMALACAAGCGGGDDAPGGSSGTPSVFVAFASSFKDFRTWASFDVTKDALPGTVHPDAQLIEYLNKRPPTGSTSFPVGTILVKEPTTADGTPTTEPFFAMVKQGGGFNAEGADGWKWFELQNVPIAPGVQIVWSGVGPPNGEVYGGDPNAGCNTCHRDCGNDAVCAKSVRLTDF